MSGPERAEALARPDEICRGLRSRRVGRPAQLRARDRPRLHDPPRQRPARRAEAVRPPARRKGPRQLLRRGVHAERHGRGRPAPPLAGTSTPRGPCTRAPSWRAATASAASSARSSTRSSAAAGTSAPCSGSARGWRPLPGRSASASSEARRRSSACPASRAFPRRPRATAQICALAPASSAQRRCAEGATGHFVFYYDGTAEAKVFCRTLGVAGRRVLPRRRGAVPAMSELSGRLRSGVWAAFAGICLQLVGAGWDTLQHHNDPGLAARESVVSLTNPSHLLMALGVSIAASGDRLVPLLAGRQAHRPAALARGGRGGDRAGDAVARHRHRLPAHGWRVGAPRPPDGRAAPAGP